MKVTKKLQAEINALMNDFWNAYFRGDIGHWRNYLVDDYRNIGGTEEEIWNSKKEILDYTFGVIDQMVGKTEIRNKETQIIPYDPYIMVHEFMDLFIKVEDEWTFYGKFRLSSLIQNTPSGWKVLHQHGSYPDSHTEQGEAFAFDKLKEENTQLREAVKRRTIELENKNRELEIEASLERVRTVAMAMNKPDDIMGICKIIFTELQSLGFADLRNTIINFWIDDSENLIDYDFSDVTGANKSKLSSNQHPVFEQFNKSIKKSKDAFAKIIVKKDQLESWIKRRREGGEYDDPRLNDIPALYYYFYSIGVGAIGISTFHSLTNEKLDLLKRFRNVFDLAYRRYKDVEIAEAQAREAQIEAALEKVRAKVMAMKSSNDLNDTSLVFGEQLRKLGIDWQFSYFWLIEEDKDENTFWITWPDNKTSTTTYSLKEADESFRECITAWKQKDKIHFTFIPTDGVLEWLNTFERITADAGGAALEIMQPDNYKNGIYYYDAMIRFGSFGILINRLINDEEKNIQCRFAIEFERAYTRFLDLQKAESQAREAQIEAAVERIRSKALAMHKSKDLHGVVITLKSELLNLNIQGVSAVSMYLEQDDGSIRGLDLSGMTDGEEEGSAFKMDVTFKLEDTDPDLWIRKIWNGNEHYFVIEADEADFERIIKWLYTIDEKEAAIAEKIIKQEGIKKAWLPTVKLEKGKLNIDVLEPPTPEIETILVKIGAAFDLAYTRFLDLQKAEAQAIEANIEVALERVRSKAMAMHTSKELIEVAKELRKQVGILGTKDLETCTINLYEESPDNVRAWAGSRPAYSEGEILELDILFPKKGIEIIEEVLQAYQSGIEELVITVEGAKLMEWLQVLRKALPDIPAIVMDSTDLENIPESKVWWSCAFFPGGCLVMITMSPPGEVSRSLLKRFSQVFGMAYRRFADLQKAEEQAREAQIEVAVERVRAKALAMHKSDEIMTVVLTMRNELESLNIPGVLSTSITLRQDDGSIRLWDNTSTKQLEDGLWESTDMVFRLEENNPEFYFNRIWNTNEKYFVIEQYENDLPITVDWVRSFDSGMADTIEHYFKENDIKHCWHPGVQLTHGKLNLDSLIAPEPEMETILLKMGAAFDLAYKRFLDLQKAEAQAREAQIEVALERVRSRAMAMHKSDELASAAQLLYQEFLKLGIKTFSCGYMFIDEEKNSQTSWMVLPDGTLMSDPITFPLTGDQVLDSRYADWKLKKPLHVYMVQGESNVNHHRFLSKYVPSLVIEEIFSKVPDRLIFNCANFSEGYLLILAEKDFNEEEQQTIIRFANVFEMTYTRFLDLKKAEAQAREAQIQLALERIRARAMAMQKSDELLEVISVLAEQLQHLNIKYDNVSFAERNQAHDYKFWTSVHGLEHPMYLEVPYINNPMFESVRDIKVEELNLYSDILNHEESRHWHQHVFEHSQLKSLPDEIKEYVLSSGYARTIAFMPTIMFIIGNYLSKPYSIEENGIIKRFAGVFEQSYTRFLDLQKAEAQAREAQIEAALERVRSRSNAMQRSENLFEVISEVNAQLLQLGFRFDSADFMTDYSEKGYKIWLASAQETFSTPMYITSSDTKIPGLLKDVLERGDDFFTFTLNREEKNRYFEHVFNTPEAKNASEESKQYVFNSEGMAVSCVVVKNIILSITNFACIPYTESENDIIKRFGFAFEQSYTRFLDLQKAEAQAREAQIEAALERVRSRTIGMQKSEELREVIQIVFEQLRYLGFKIDSAHFNLNYKESDDYNLWTAAPGQPYPVKTYIPYFNHPVFATAREAKEKGLDFFTESYTREEKNEFFEHLFSYAPGIPEERRKYILNGQGVAASTVLLNQISLWIMNYSGVPYSAAENAILKRFGKIFEQSHTRFLDLQKAEAQAREAVKQASLDRIRAEIASMRTTGDLETITPLIWNELTVLGVPFIRCGVFIMNDLQRIAHTYLSTPDGKAIAAFDLAYDTPGNISQIVHQWQNKKLYIDYWDEEAYTAFAGNLVHKGIFTTPDQYFSTLPGGGFYLHFAPFLQGMLYVGNTTQLSDEEINLIQSVANAFATAYARYEDFNKLEAAKKQVDNTLNELQLTQKQLIQSEKMASLGELTAGIAHEIQNPLNFVNNFSEINKELLHEMNEEIEKGNLKEVKLLAKNIIENEQKINHHGTRADAIVKGMLQHSRTSSGQKEPTDINELADEYLRLAYHGLRAKDKTFNATLNTNFDETISNINIVPQDIGRVILNLITNAFYAVDQKKKECQSEQNEDYQPTVTLSTKKINDKIEIKVADNGNGIPQNIIDKIFQPFFSTKPAGQGTGLGLSLSYDIVKAHGGEIKVHTKEREGSEFIIQLRTK